jgi:hypothetical protein
MSPMFVVAELATCPVEYLLLGCFGSLRVWVFGGGTLFLPIYAQHRASLSVAVGPSPCSLVRFVRAFEGRLNWHALEEAHVAV